VHHLFLRGSLNAGVFL